MKLRLCLYLAAISLALASIPAETARRPRYGGVLRVEIGAVVTSLDPGAVAASLEEDAARDQIDALIYERRGADGKLVGDAGSGPFLIGGWEPGKHATLKANEDFRGGRPFVDSIQIQMGRAAQERMLDLELSKTDLAGIPVEQARRAADRGVRISTSQPDELLALVFPAGRATTDDVRVREALSQAIDRSSIVNFILQKNGEAAGGLLPQWSSGTAFLFSTAADSAHAKELWSQIARPPKLVLGYDSGDPLEQSVAERIAVNAREAGISLMAQSIPGETAAPAAKLNIDARLMRWRMPSPFPRAALTNFLATLGPAAGIDASVLPDSATPEDIYNRERPVVSSYRVVPLVWLPQVYGLSARVRNWKAPGPGEAWPLADVWLDVPADAASEKEKP
ncbi:MAG: ABC transporter substrate-binding protein [Candidatus Acidiferrales bacterium]